LAKRRIQKVKTLNCEGADTVIEQIKQALKIGGKEEKVY
jgi:hypothetical protein